MIETVLGEISPDQVGRTLMHEHLFVGDHELERTFPQMYARDRAEAVSATAELLESAYASGFRTIVDQTVLGLGRDVELLREVAALSRVNIVVATGAYVYRDLPHSLQLRGPGRTAFGGPDPLTELFVGELTEGIAGTRIRAALIKVATDRFGVTKDVDRVLRAAARAHRQTGALISTHTNAKARVGLDQQRIFSEEGVDLSRTLIGHSGDTDDMRYLETMLEQGSYLGMDRFGLDYFLPFDRRVQVVADLCAQGYAGQLVLSHDVTCRHIGYTSSEMAVLAPKSAWDHIPNDVVPELLRRGVSVAQIEQMLVTNPRTLLSPTPLPDVGTGASRRTDGVH